MVRVVAGAVVIAVVLSACSAGPPSLRSGRDRRPRSPAPVETLPTARPLEAQQRPATTRPRVEAPLGELEPRARRAIRDLKTVGMWRRLTRHLYVIQITVVHGRSLIPRDLHLADAWRTWQLDERGKGPRCEIRFYSAAVTADLARQRDYHARGMLPGPVPTPRQLWGSVLAHELSHCGRSGTRDEHTANHWEDAAFDALRKEGLE